MKKPTNSSIKGALPVNASRENIERKVMNAIIKLLGSQINLTVLKETRIIIVTSFLILCSVPVYSVCILFTTVIFICEEFQ
jgi:hypothetical protein